ncbi:Fe-S cluster assembly protein SufD [Vibrio bathopelagicus]|uniref:Fe-S cluster assembly protein SufD n=1 Tax=Vibrio bathopelagicus TaxID=2777577 RepID=UPI0018641E9C|nr:Fe-S cluster assembly protein SufD [Vibrio bathopelagicus]
MDGSLMKNKLSLLDSFQTLVQPNEWQNKQWSKLLGVGLPSSKHEDWKYTPFNRLEQLELIRAPAQPAANTPYNEFSLDIDAYRLVFVDGYFSARYSDWVPKVRVTPISALSPIETDELSRSIKPDAFTYITDATASCGVLIEVEANTQISKPIYLLHVNSGKQGDVSSYRNHIEVAEHSEINVIEHHVSQGDRGAVTLSRLTQHIGCGAHYHHTKIVEESSTQHHFGHNDITISAHASAHSCCMLYSGQLIRHQVSSVLAGEQGFVSMDSVSLPQSEEIFDTRTYLKHNAPHCVSEQNHKIIARELSKSVFDGMIYVDPVAQKTDGQMNTHSLILGDYAQVNSKPQLEIYADDVKCSHGATTGQIDPNQINYLRSRGIPKQRAEHMITSAFAIEVAERIKHPALRQYAIDKINASLNKESDHD